MEKHTCEQEVWGDWSHHKCGKNAKYEHEGKWYCGIHYPPKVEEKRKKRREEERKQWDYKTTLCNARTGVLLAENDVIDEVKRAVELKIELPELLYEAYCKLIIAAEELGRVVKEGPR